MKSTILDLLRGDEWQVKLELMPKELWDYAEKMSDSDEALRKVLSGESLALLDKFQRAIEDMHCAESDEYLLQGFKLGLRIGMEVLADGCR